MLKSLKNKTLRIMKKIIAAIFIMATQIYSAQQAADNNTNLANIIPPSPTAYALGNYGNVPVGLFTGTVNFSVPLLTYKTNNITLPLTMFYGSNGVKLDEVSSNVGLGWNLNYGGVISRTVRDKPDDTSQKLQIPSNAFEINNAPAYWNFIYGLGNLNANTDTEADIYSFNFNGVSGKFFYDRNSQIHLIEQQALKIEKSTDGFIITLPNGEKYYFEEKETTNFKTLGIGHQLPNIGATAYYLTKIVHPKGDEVYFAYENMYLNYTSSQSQNCTITQPYTTCQGTSVTTSMSSMGVVAQNMMTVSGKRIKTISSNTPLNGSVNFTYSTDNVNIDVEGNYKIQNITQADKNGNSLETVAFTYLNTANKRNFLSSVIFKDPKKSYVFEYEKPSQLDVRLSYSRDYWGYYNGKGNGVLVPKISDPSLNNFNYYGADQEPDPNFAKMGLLKKITYPTKGYTELEYEGNTYWGTKTITPAYSYLGMAAQNNTIVGTVTQQYAFTSPMDQTVQISGMSGFNSECTESSQTHTPIGRIGVTNPAGTSLLSSQFTNDQTNTVQFNAVAGVNYTIKLSASRCTFIWADARYYPFATQVFDTNLDTGGIRIKSTKDYDAPSSVPKYTRYYYGPKNDINHSSGDKGRNPAFVYKYISSEVCNGDGMICIIVPKPYLTISSNSLLPLFDTDKNTSTFYKYVTVSNGGDNFERGGETKEFIINRDYAGSQLWGTNDIITTPYTNYGWDNGFETSSEILRKNATGNLETVQSKENNYITSDASTFELKNFTHRRNDLLECQMTTPYYCTQANTITPGHACNGKSAGDIINMPYIANLDVNEYRTISYWKYLKSQSTTEYLNGSSLSTETEYFYDNPVNYQLSRQKITFPDTNISETSYQYAHEKGNQLLISRNMIGIPLQTEVTQTIYGVSKTLSKTETVYPVSIPTSEAGSLMLPLSVKSYDIPNNITNSEVKLDKYDQTNGNLLQYTLKTGTPVTIVWGYNNTQPIAKIEGITYDQLVNLGIISGIVLASDADASNPAQEGALLVAFENFRNSAGLKNLPVTNMTYDPLIGMTNVIMPTGLRQVYIYDTATNRLKEIRENDPVGKILKEFRYNYKN
jgi:hypothetical protein